MENCFLCVSGLKTFNKPSSVKAVTEPPFYYTTKTVLYKVVRTLSFVYLFIYLFILLRLGVTYIKKNSLCDIQQKAIDTFFFEAQFMFLDNFWKLFFLFKD